MTRLIDADELLSKKKIMNFDGYDSLYYVDVSDIIHAPTADAEKVQHGKWIYHCNEDADADIKDEIWGYHECSNCHFGTVGTTSYCPKCGAKMDGE